MSTILGQLLNAPITASSTKNDSQVSSAVLWGIPSQVMHALGVSCGYSAAVASIKPITFYRGGQAATGGTGLIRTSGLVRGTTDTRVGSIEFEYAIAGVQYHKAAVAAGTVLAAGTIPQDTWGSYLFSINAAGTITSTAAPLNFTTGYATEAAALAYSFTLPSASAGIGLVTIQTKTGTTFIGGTDGLTGGASGNVANATNYYSSNASVVYAPATNLVYEIPWDFTAGPLIVSLPGVLRGDQGEGLMAQLPASGAGGVTGQIHLFGFYK